MEDRFRAAEGDDRHGQGRARAGTVREDRAAADRQRGRIEAAETADGEDLRGFAGQRERVDGLGAREGIGLQAGGLVGRRPGGGKDVLGGREAREGDDTVRRVVGREAVAVDGDAGDQAVGLSGGGREGDPVGRRAEGAGDVERSGPSDAERAEGQALFAAAAHDESAAARIQGQSGRSGVGGLRRGRERLSRAGGGRVSADDELGAIGDRDDRRADRDVRTGHHHARLKARGASDGDSGVGVDGGTTGEGLRHDRGRVRDGFQHAAAQVESAVGGAETVHRVRRRVVEDELSVLEHDHGARRITQRAGADDVRGTPVDTVMVMREGVGGRDIDDVVVDLIDVEAVSTRGVGVDEVAGNIDRALAEQVEEDVAIIGRGHVRADRAEGQGGAEVGTDAVVTVDVVVAADRIQQAQLAVDDVDTVRGTNGAQAVDAGDVGPVARAGEVDDRSRIERQGRSRGGRVRTEHELGRVGDGGDGRAGGDIGTGDEHARGKAGGAGDGDGRRGIGRGAAGQGDRGSQGHSARKFERGGHAADVQDTGGELVGGGSADHAHVDIQRTGPAGVVGAEHQGAGGLLGQRGGRTAGTFKRGGERDGLARRDFDLTGVGGVTEDDRTSEGKVFGETQGGSSTGSRRQDDLVGGVAELAFGRDREHAALDGHITREVIGGVAEHEGAVARLRETGAGDLAAEGESLGQIMEGSTGDRVDGISCHREGLVGQQPVGVVVGEGETEAEVRDDPRGDGLVDGLVQRQGAASAAHGDVRDDAGVELDQTGEGDGLRHGGAIAVREQGQRGRITERGGVEVTGVAGRVEDELTETLDLEGGDRSDVRDLTEHRDDEIRAVDTDRGDAAALADGEGTVEREGAARGAGVIEGRQAGEREVVADRTIVIVDEEGRAGGEADGAGAERTRGETEAALLRGAVVG